VNIIFDVRIAEVTRRFRKFDIPRNVPEPSEAQVEAAEAMIRRLRFPYDPENFDNPVIQTHYKNLEAMALEKPDIEPIEDHTSTYMALTADGYL